MKRLFQEKSHEEDSDEDTTTGLISVPDMRLLSLYGAVDEKKASELVYSMIVYSRIKKLTPLDKANPPVKFSEYTEPLEFLISTPGGSACDMFSIYDTMRIVREGMEIHTTGMGQVMSAGVLLLAAGTKGKRKIGKNCRVMIHAVVGGLAGSSHDIQNEMNEILFTQGKYIKALVKETKMNQAQIKTFLDEKRNIYLSAEEAVKYGIADIVV